MKKLDELIDKFYYLFEQRSEWHYLKSLLDKLNLLISNKQSFTLKQFIALSKLIYLSLSSNVSQVHRQVYVTLEMLLSKSNEPRFYSLLSYSLFSHCKRVDKATIDDFLQTLVSYLGKVANNQNLTLGYLTALLSNLDAKKQVVEISLSIIERYPIVGEELVWAVAIQARNSSQSVLNLLENIKHFKADLGIIMKGFVSGISNQDPRCKYAAADTICAHFSLKNKKFHNAKVFIFSCLLKLIHDQRIFLRISKFITDDRQEYLEQVIIEAVNYLLSKNQLFDITIIAKLQDPDNDFRFITPEFYKQTFYNLVVNIGKYHDEVSEEYLMVFKQLFQDNNYEAIACLVPLTFENVQNWNECREYFKGLIFINNNINFNQLVADCILNTLFDNSNYFHKIPEYFLCCSCYLKFTFPLNISHFLAFFNNQLEFMPIVCLQNFSQLYMKILKINKKIRIKQFSFNQQKLTESSISILKIIVYDMKVPLNYENFQLLWDNFFGEFHEDIKFILLYSGNDKKKWVKNAVKNLKTIKGTLAVYSFFNYCFLEKLTILTRQRIVYFFYLELFQVVDNDYCLQPYLFQLWVLITSDVSVFFKPIFLDLIEAHYEFSQGQSSVRLLKVFEALQFAIFKKNVEALSMNLIIEDGIKDKINSLKWFRTSINVYSDLLSAICFKYIITNSSQKDFSIAAFNLFHTYTKHAKYQQALKIFEFSNECLQLADLKISAKILIIKILASLNFSQIFAQQKSILRNSFLISLPKFIKGENIEKINLQKSKFEKFLGTLIQFFFSLSEFYIDENLNDLVPAELVKLIFISIKLYPDNENSCYLLEFINKFSKKLSETWIVGLLFGESLNIIDLLKISENCESPVLLNVLSNILLNPAVNNIEFTKGLIKLWAVYKSSDSDKSYLKTLIKYIPFFNLSLEKILSCLSQLISSTNDNSFHICYISFLVKFSKTYQFELELNQKSVIFIETIMKKVKLPLCFIPLSKCFYCILKYEQYNKILSETCKVLKEYYKKFFDEFFERGLTSYINSLEVHNQRYSAICNWLKSFGHNFCQILWERPEELHKTIESWCRTLIKKVNFKYPIKDAFSVFSSWSKNTVLFSQHIRPVLMDIASNNSKILKVLSENPSACFSWCEVLNQCSAHTKLFEDFRSVFIPIKKNNSYIQENARICFVTALLIYSGDTDDYLNPKIYYQIQKELNEIIFIDNFFPIAMLVLMVLSVRLSFDGFSEIIKNFWPVILTKFYENQKRSDLIVYCSLLKLLDLLVALEFNGILQIQMFSREPIIGKNGWKKQLVVQIPEKFNIKILNEQQEKLIKHFNTVYNEEGEFDTKAVSLLIESEFYRCKELA